MLIYFLLNLLVSCSFLSGVLVNLRGGPVNGFLPEAGDPFFMSYFYWKILLGISLVYLKHSGKCE